MGWVPFAQAGLSALGGLFGGGGESNDAVAAQAAVNQQLLRMFQQQQAQEAPFRQAMMQQANARAQQRFPQFQMPTQAPTFNPFTRMSGAPRPQPAEGGRPGGSFLTTKAELPQQAGSNAGMR